MSEYATVEYYVDHVIGEIAKRDVEKVSERLRALGWEEVVRCRDCEYYDPHPAEGGVCFLPDGDGDFARWGVEPNGFCKWGERRNDE